MAPVRTFGRFEVVRELGRGASAVVLEAVDPQLGRRVALKLLLSGERAAFEEEERFRREADALARVRHPNVVAVHEAGALDGVPYVVLEPVEGQPLARLLAAGAPREVLLGALEQAARGVAAAHAAGVVHRDLKPEHVLVDAAGRARVIDFGLARLGGASVDLTRSGQALGTAPYMAPEVARGELAAIGPWSDVWSLGAILLEVLSGAPPYPQARSAAQLVACLAGPEEPPRARARRPEVPRALDEVCARALRKDPRGRFADAGQLAEALARARLDRRERRGPPTRLVGVVAVAVLLLVGAAWGVLQALPGPPSSSQGTPTSGAAVPSAVIAEAPAPRAPPAWVAALPPAARPPAPLPAGLRWGEAGEVVAEPDQSVLVWIPPGPFVLGGEGGAGERQARRRELVVGGFFAGKHEVRVAQFAAFVAATGYRTQAERMGGSVVAAGERFVTRPGASWRDPHGDGRAPPGDHPVLQVTWEDARAYAAWAGLSLPREVQWERAAAWDAREGRSRRYPWGDLPPAGSPCPANLAGEADGHPRAAPVGAFPGGASPAGVLDACGNAAEWCLDAWAPNAWASDEAVGASSGGPELTLRVLRGGSWVDPPARASAHWRGKSAAGFSCDTIGFRLVREP